MADLGNPLMTDARQRIALMMLQNGSDTSPIKSWTQGAARVANALFGGMMLRQQREDNQQAVASLVNSLTGTPGATPQATGTPTGIPQPSATSSIQTGAGSTNPISPADAIASMESGGKYDAVGPVTKTGDKAYGKYGIMGANVGPWTKEALGYAETPDQFLNDPKGQDAVFQNKFVNQYEPKYGPEGAARAWLGGPGNVNNPNATDQLGTSVGSYGQKFTQATGGVPTPAAPTPTTGAPATNPAMKPILAQPSGPSIPANVRNGIMTALSSDSPVAQGLAVQMLSRYMQPTNYGFQTLPDGTVVRTNPLTGSIDPVYRAQTPYQLMPQPDGTVMAVNPRNPKDSFVAYKGAAKPITVAPGATIVVPNQPGAVGDAPAAGANPAGAPTGASTASPTSPGFKPVYQNTTGLFDNNTLTSMADQYLAGDKSVLQNLGRTTIGGMNMSALRERIVSRAHELGISPTETASRIGQFDSYTSGQKATGTRGGNVTMAATEASNLGNLVLDTSGAVPRTNYPIWNKVTNSYAENTGDPNIVKFTGALNSYINAYARAINPSGSTTVSDKEHAREILDTAMSHGQIEAGISQLQAELEQAKRAPASASQTLKGEFTKRADPHNSDVLSQARDAIGKGADRNAVIQRLKQMGVDTSGL